MVNKEYLKTMVSIFKESGSKKLNVSRRNKKLVPSAEVDFVIWNLPAQKTCPGKTGHCSKNCYARKAEKCYPTCLPSRERNFIESEGEFFARDMIFTILSIALHSKKPAIIVRIHESGDFYSKEYAEKWLLVMEVCRKVDSRIRFIAYTKSFAFFDGVTLPVNFSLRASVWDDTPARDLEIIARNGWDIYTAVDKFTDDDKFTQCRCDDCATCGQCWSREHHDIRCEIH